MHLHFLFSIPWQQSTLKKHVGSWNTQSGNSLPSYRNYSSLPPNLLMLLDGKKSNLNLPLPLRSTFCLSLHSLSPPLAALSFFSLSFYICAAHLLLLILPKTFPLSTLNCLFLSHLYFNPDLSFCFCPPTDGSLISQFLSAPTHVSLNMSFP